MVKRKPEYQVEDLILDRWSPRAMSGESISHYELMSLIDAARWAPSSYNNQPWRFIYAHRDTSEWDKLFNLVVSANQEWVKNGAALVLVVSHNNFEYNNLPARTHSLDAGASTQNFALQGSAMNLVVHGLEGFDYDRARMELMVPNDYTVEAMYVVGKHAPKEVLPSNLAEREEPSDRKKVEEITFHGFFGNKPKTK